MTKEPRPERHDIKPAAGRAKPSRAAQESSHSRTEGETVRHDIIHVASACEMTGLEPTPPLTDDEEDAYASLGSVPAPHNKRPSGQ